MKIYKVEMSLNDYFNVSKNIVAVNILLIDKKITFITDKNSIKFLVKNNVDYTLISNGINDSIRRMIDIKSLLLGSILFLIIIYINTFRINNVLFNNEYPINDEIELKIYNNSKQIFNMNYISKKMDKLEEEIRHEYVNYQWISLNKVGGNIYVTISDFDTSNISYNSKVNGNVCSSMEGIIVSAKCYNGILNVKENDYVKKGDILISGENIKEARGEVIAEVFYTSNFHILKNMTKSYDGEVKKYYSLEIFNKSIKLSKFKGYINSNVSKKNVFSLSTAFSLKRVTETEKCGIIEIYDKQKALSLVNSLISNEFNSNKVSNNEKIISIMPILINENEDSFDFSMLIKARSSIGLFEKTGEN